MLSVRKLQIEIWRTKKIVFICASHRRTKSQILWRTKNICDLLLILVLLLPHQVSQRPRDQCLLYSVSKKKRRYTKTDFSAWLLIASLVYFNLVHCSYIHVFSHWWLHSNQFCKACQNCFCRCLRCMMAFAGAFTTKQQLMHPHCIVYYDKTWMKTDLTCFTKMIDEQPSLTQFQRPM